MRSHELLESNVEIREIDLRNIDLCSSGNIITPEYMVNYHDSHLTIFLTDAAENYAIQFGDLKYDDADIAIYGSNNNVILYNSCLNVKTIKANVSQLVIEEDCSIKAVTQELTVAKIENHGEVQITGLHQQNGGSFINGNYFNASQFLMQDGAMFWNKEGADFFVEDKQQIACESYFADGVLHAGESLVKADNITLDGEVGGKQALLFSRDVLCASETAVLTYGLIKAISQNELIVDGKVQHYDEALFFGKNTTITEKAVFADGGCLDLAAKEYLHCEPGAVISNLKKMTVSGKYLLIDCDIDVDTDLQLHPIAYFMLHPNRVVRAQQIKLMGNDYYLYGNVLGDISTPAPIRHLYLADRAALDRCNHLNVRGAWIELYGKVMAKINEISAESRVQTDELAIIKGDTHVLTAPSIGLAGELASRHMESNASEQLTLHPQLKLNGHTFVANAQDVILDGEVTGNVIIKSTRLVNHATLSEGNMAAVEGAEIIVNAPDSSLTFDNIEMKGKKILDQGLLTASETINESAIAYTQDTHASKSAMKDSVKAQHAVLGGTTTAKVKSSNKATESVTFVKDQQVNANKVSIKTSGVIDGTLNATSEKTKLIAAKKAELVDSELDARQSLLIGTNALMLDATVASDEVKLLQPKVGTPSDDITLNISPQTNIHAAKFVETFSEAKIQGKLSVGEGYFQSEKYIELTELAEVDYEKLVQIKSATANVGCKITSASQSVFAVQANTAIFQQSTYAKTLSPIEVNADSVKFAGTYDASIVVQANNTVFENDCHIRCADNKLIIVGKTAEATVTIEPSALIESVEAMLQSIRDLKVEGVFAPRKLMAIIEEITVAARGRLGGPESSLAVKTDYFYLDGELQAEAAAIKCRRLFLQNGFHGDARIDARNINITSPVYLNLFGTTEAQQASMTSFLAACLGFEFINYKVNNSVINIKLLPSAIHLRFLSQVIDDIRQGKINILDKQYLQYSMQTMLAILQSVMPGLLAKSISVGASAYFIYSNITELKKCYSQANFNEMDLVDYLPLLVSMKNILISGTMLVENAIDLVPGLKDYLFDKVEDLGKYLGVDLAKTLRDLFHIHQTKKEGENPEPQPNPKPEPKPDVPVKTDPTFYESLQDWYDHFSLHDFSFEAFDQYILPVASVLAPSVIEDSVINLNILAPVFTGVSTQRSLINFSWGSPVTGLFSSKTAGCLVDNDNDFAYMQSRIGLYVAMSESTHAHSFNLHAWKFNQARGTKIRATHATVNLPTMDAYDIKGEKSLTLHYSSVNGSEDDLLRFKGKFSCFRPNDTRKFVASFVTDHDYIFNKNTVFDWGVKFQGNNIHIGKGVKIKSKGEVLGFTAADGSVLNQGKLKSAGMIYEVASDKVTHQHATTKEEKLVINARNDVTLDHSNDKTTEAYVTSNRGRVSLHADSLRSTRFLYVNAHTDVVAQYEAHDTKHKGVPDKHYHASLIKGGDGYGYGGVGLVVVAGDKIINDGSKIGAMRDYQLYGHHGIDGYAPHNIHVHKKHTHYHWTGTKKTEYVVSEHIQRETFFSDNGSGLLSAKHGDVHVCAAKFDNAKQTYVYSREKPVFEDFNVHTVSHTKSSWLGVTLNEKIHIEDAMLGQVFISPKMFGIECLYGDIDVGNTTIKTPLLYTNAWDGSVHIYQTPVQQHDISWSLSLGCNIGPFHYTHSFNPDDKHQDVFTVPDPLLDSIKSTKSIHDAADAGCALVNAADAAVGKMHGELMNSTVGVNVGYTRTETYSQRPGDASFEVGYWLDDSKSVAISNIPTAIGVLQMRCGDSINVNGEMLHYHTQTNSVNVGVGFDFATNSVYGSAGYAQSHAKGSTAAVCPVHIDTAIFGNDVVANIDNGSLTIDHLYGNISSGHVTSHADVTSASSANVSVSTNGGVSLGGNHVEASEVKHVSLLNVVDATHGHVGEVSNSAVVSKHHETGFSLSYQNEQHTISNIGYVNATDITAANGKTHHHGTNLSLNNPVNLFGLFQRPASPPLKEVEQQLLLVNDDANVDELLTNTQLQAGYAAFDKDGNYYGFIPLESLSPSQTEDEHGKTHFHFPTPKEVRHIWSLEMHEQVKVYRGDARPPELIFKRGFVAKGTNDDLVSHVNGFKGAAPADSRYIATSLSKKTAALFPVSGDVESLEKTYIYTINLHDDAVDVSAKLQAQGLMSKYDEQEMAFIDAINPRDIEGVNVQHLLPNRYTEEIFIQNPNYRKIWTMGDVRVGAVNVVSYGLTYYSIAQDAYALTYAASQGHAPFMHEATNVGGKWAGAYAMTQVVMPYVTKGMNFAIRAIPRVAVVSPATKLGFMIFSSTVGSYLGEKSIGHIDVPSMLHDFRELTKHNNHL